jgi:hypothetical protein
MDKIKKVEERINKEILLTKDELLTNYGVELESFKFEFEPRYKNLIENLDNSKKIYFDPGRVGFALFIPSIEDKQRDFVVYFAIALQKSIITTAPKSGDSKEEFPYLLISIPASLSLSKEDVYSHLLPSDSFLLENGYITFRFNPLVRYKEFII